MKKQIGNAQTGRKTKGNNHVKLALGKICWLQSQVAILFLWTQTRKWKRNMRTCLKATLTAYPKYITKHEGNFFNSNLFCFNKNMHILYLITETKSIASSPLQWTRQFRVIDSSGSPSHKHFCFSRMSKYIDLLIIPSFSQIY